MAEYKCKGIILKTKEHRESDQIVSVYTDTQGRQTLRAPFARKSKRRFAGMLQSFAEHTLAIEPKKQTWSVLLRVESLSLHQALRLELGAFAAASYAGELFLRLTKEHDPNIDLYRLLASYLTYCETNQLTPKAFCRFHLQLLRGLGFQPNWEHCMECGSPYTSSNHRFAFELGGVLCSSCLQQREFRLRSLPLPLSLHTLLTALQKRQKPPESSPKLWQEAIELFDKRIEILLGSAPKSRGFLFEMLGF